MIIRRVLDLGLPLAALPNSIGPYASLMVLGFVVAIFGHLTRSRWLVAIGVILIFLAAVLLPIALRVTTDNPPPPPPPNPNNLVQ
jgi:hypothetical protein